jgi:glyoxylase-like metal-dependent hydrolase (beta-lactamase superfamily II)
MFRVQAVPGNHQRLDGGAMFGNAPRAVWSRWCAPDEQGRIELACRAMLVEDGDRRVLFETGIGAFFEPKLRERYGVLEAEHVLLRSLDRLGLSDRDIDMVVLSHLHFDHAGGLLAQWADGQPPQLLFPRAVFLVGATALDRAEHPHPRDRASFIPELPTLLRESGRLRVVADAAEADVFLGPRYRFRESFGHTPGMLHAEVIGAHGRVFFCADLVPGTAWVHLPITMGYDRFPERLIDEKTEFFADFIRTDTHLFFTHDVSVAAARLERGADGRYQAAPTLADFGPAWDLDHPHLELRETPRA